MKTTFNRNLFAWLLIASVSIVTSCKDDNEAVAPTTLYTRLGGIDAISAVTDKFLANVVADNVINERFSATVADEFRLRLLRTNLIDQICAGSGGPCQYKGLSMMEAHAGMDISVTEFNALVGDLVAALDFYKVPEAEKGELLAVLGPLQSQIVGQ